MNDSRLSLESIKGKQPSSDPEREEELETENLMAQLWGLLFGAMQLVPREHPGQARAISLLER